MFGKLLFVLSVMVVIAGCRSDIYYHNRAADRARKFLFENNNKLNMDDRLNVSEMNFVRYNAPVLLYNDLLGDKSRGRRFEALETDVDQICVVWQIPGRNKVYMVYGVSGARMDFWYPERVIVKQVRDVEPPGMTAVIAAARDYAQSNFFQEMTAKDINFIRFTAPELRRTAFEINFDVDGKTTAEKYEEIRAAAASRIQYSLVWKLSEKYLVITGFSEPGLANWSVSFAGLTGEEELKAATKAVVIRSADAYKPFPQEEITLTTGMLAQLQQNKDQAAAAAEGEK